MSRAKKCENEMQLTYFCGTMSVTPAGRQWNRRRIGCAMGLSVAESSGYFFVTINLFLQ